MRFKWVWGLACVITVVCFQILATIFLVKRPSLSDSQQNLPAFAASAFHKPHQDTMKRDFGAILDGQAATFRADLDELHSLTIREKNTSHRLATMLNRLEELKKKIKVMGDQTKAPIDNQEEARQPLTNCKVIVFANGGKCGSTALWMMLTHAPPEYADYDGTTGIQYSNKEECMEVDYPQCEDPKKPFLVDACPRHWLRRAPEVADAAPDATVVLLVRDQVSRLTSFFNDRLSSRTSYDSDIDIWFNETLRKPMSQYDNFIDTYMAAVDNFPERNVLIIHHDDLLQHPQRELDRIYQHSGLTRRVLQGRVIKNNAYDAGPHGRHMKKEPSERTKALAREHFKEVNEQFLDLAGVRIDKD